MWQASQPARGPSHLDRWWPSSTQQCLTLAVRSVFNPRIGRSRALSRPWSHSTRSFAYYAVLWTASGHQLGDDVSQRSRAIGNNLIGATVRDHSCCEERPCRRDVAAPRDKWGTAIVGATAAGLVGLGRRVGPLR